jgi:hypothetical protein
VILSGHDQQIERLVGFEQRLHHLHRGRWVDVGVELPDHEKDITLQAIRVVDAGRG